MVLLLVALATTALAAPAVRVVMLRHGVLDVPNHRSSHVAPVPRGGGWACIVGLVVAAVVAAALGRAVLWPVLAGAVLLGVVGFADDRRGLSPVLRLAAQGGTGLLIGLAIGGPWAAVGGAVLFAGFVNAVNFMDGINGITGLTLAVWGGSVMVAGTSYTVPGLVTLGAITAGGAIGFLPWNLPRARLFLGDVGSYLFGALVAGGILLAWVEAVPPVLVVASMTLYLVDTGSTLVRRALAGEPLLSAHRDHVYQRLVSPGGLPHHVVAVVVAALAAGVTAMWWLLEAVPATLGSVVVAAGYLALPQLVALRRPRSVRRELS